MEFTANTRRASNRLTEHTLAVVRKGLFRGQPAVLTCCTEADCDWNGWFTPGEMTTPSDTNRGGRMSHG